MILVGIDIAKDKHECFIRTLEGTVLHKSFFIANNLEGFEELYSKICSCNDKLRSGLRLPGIIPTTFWVSYSVKIYRRLSSIFSELESAVSTLHLNCIYAMLLKYPSAKDIAKSRFNTFANLIESASKGRLDKLKAKEIRNLARKSVGVYLSAKAMELKHTIKLIQVLDSEIEEIEQQI